ncbi:MAG: N-acetylmuramoyl-L-alanine amidase [Nitrospirae bacterium]|nr:N-acetylmuramoyl-L-alanine amidase [Magnetococcales bacterium]
MKRRSLLQVLAVSAGGVMFPFSFAVSEDMGSAQLIAIEPEVDSLRLVFSILGEMTTKGFILDNPDRAVLDFVGAPLRNYQELTGFNNPLVRRIRFGEQSAFNSRLVLDLLRPARMELSDEHGMGGKREWIVYLRSAEVSKTEPARQEVMTDPQGEEPKKTVEKSQSQEATSPSASKSQGLTMQDPAHDGEMLRVVFSTPGTIKHRGYILNNPDRVVLDFFDTDIENADLHRKFSNEWIKGVRFGHPVPNGVRVVFDSRSRVDMDINVVTLTEGAGQELILRMNKSGQSLAQHPVIEKPATPPHNEPPESASSTPPPSLEDKLQTNTAPPIQAIPETPARLKNRSVPMEAAAPTQGEPLNDQTQQEIPYSQLDQIAPKKKPDPPVLASRAYPGYRAKSETVIVVDPGHGGIDPGTCGREGTREKDVTLAVAKRLFDKMDGIQNCRVVLTRDDDRFLTLRNRIAIAHKARADLFLSLHADAYRDPSIHGASVFCLADGVQITVDEKDQQLAHRENSSGNLQASAVSSDDQETLMELLQLDAIKRLAIADSVKFGHRLIQSLGSQPGINIHYRRVKRVNFLVLKNPGIPSSLVEMAFLSNLQDERRMVNGDYQNAIAEGLASGICQFFHFNPTRKV